MATGIYAIKPWWQRRLAGIETLLVRRNVHPDYVTLAGVSCAGLMGGALAASAVWHWLSLAVVPLAIARLAANALDGLVARRLGVARAWGEVFNEFGDRLADCAVLVGLALVPSVYSPLTWGALVLTLLSSYLGTVSKAAGGVRQYGGILGKADRMLWLAAFAPIVAVCGGWAWNILLTAFIPALLITVCQRYRLIYRQLDNRG